MTKASHGGRIVRFLCLAVAIVAGLVAVGFVPTRRLAGAAGLPAMVTGSVISLLAAGLVAVLLVLVDAPTPAARMQRAFLAMVVRLVVVLVLGSAAVLSGAFSRAPLLFWVATTYVALLPLEVRLAIAAEQTSVAERIQ